MGKSPLCASCEESLKRNGYFKIVLCNDCRHYEPLTQSCTEQDGIMTPNFYCGLGESKEGAENENGKRDNDT